jgi:N-acetyl-anhydromuramyl-L-alanine amidase AmpD
MKRIILHWSAGGHTATATDKRHYHFIVEGSGKIVTGDHPPQANAHIANPKDGSTYAAHTAGTNTGSIGVAVAAMRGAVERPFNAGPSPITPAQVDALVALVARLCKQHGIPVTRQTVLTHAEVQPTLGIKQRGKWDITWLPNMTGPIDPIALGDMLRTRVQEAMRPPVRVIASLPDNPSPAPSGGFWTWLAGLLRGRG